MFEKSLREKLERIFDLEKVTFSAPGDSREQEVLFVEIEAIRSSIKENQEICRANGKLHLFANSDKLPFAYFSKRIQLASADDTKDLFFETEENNPLFQNIVERTMGFVYFYSGQYNPETGIINEINLTVDVDE